MGLQNVSSLISNSLILCFIGGIPLIAMIRKVNVFESFALGGKDGFQIAVKIIPYVVGFLVAINMFRAAGGLDLLAKLLGPLFTSLGFPVQLLPLALIRPFSGTASTSLFVDIAHTYGGNSFLAHTAATMLGSTETTFYVVMIYFGAVSIYKTRHAIPAGLIADIAGILGAVVISHWFY